MKITQSFIKTMRKYLAGKLCGHLVTHQYVEGKFLPSTAAMKLGSYFEYIGWKNLPKDGQVPQPGLMQKAKDPTDPKTMLAPYRVAHANSKFVLKMMEDIGFKVVEKGLKLTKGNYEGTLDLICEATKRIVIQYGNGKKLVLKKGDRIVIDVKYSGLIDDKWSELGWAFEEGKWGDSQKNFHGTQAKQYHFISELPFFFMIVQNNNSEDKWTKIVPDPKVKFVHTPIDDFMIEQHITEGNAMMEKFEFEKKVGFVPRPRFNDCNQCALKDGCKDRRLLPDLEVIDLTVE